MSKVFMLQCLWQVVADFYGALSSNLFSTKMSKVIMPRRLLGARLAHWRRSYSRVYLQWQAGAMLCSYPTYHPMASCPWGLRQESCHSEKLMSIESKWR